jgi:hypothetical protein
MNEHLAQTTTGSNAGMVPSSAPSHATVEMPRYISHKRVWALEIDTIEPGQLSTASNPNPSRRITFRNAGYEPIVAPGEMFSRYIPVAGDFYVVYADGYKSFSPRKAFTEGYTDEASWLAGHPADVEIGAAPALGTLQIDELAALIRYHSGRMNPSGNLLPDAVTRIAVLSDAIQRKHVVMAQRPI